MIKLNQAEKEQIQAIMDNEAWPAVLKVAQIAVQREEYALTNCDEKPDEIWKRKCRYEGAKVVLRVFEGMRKELNKLEK